MAERNGVADVPIRVAVTQAGLVSRDLQGTVAKPCKLTAEYTAGVAKLLVSPEPWIPGYPYWI